MRTTQNRAKTTVHIRATIYTSLHEFKSHLFPQRNRVQFMLKGELVIGELFRNNRLHILVSLHCHGIDAGLDKNLRGVRFLLLFRFSFTNYR